MRNSLFLRILFPLFFALSFCWVIFILILGRASYKELYEVLDAQMVQTAQMLTVPMDYGQLPELRFSEKRHHIKTDYSIHFSVWDKNRNILYADKRGGILPSSFDENGFFRVKSGTDEYRVYTYQNKSTQLSASAGYPTSVRTKIIEEVIEKFWAPWLIGLLALGVVLFVSLWWGFQPLLKLQKEINQRDPNHLDKFTTDVPVELNNFKNELNRLIEKINFQMDKERRFTADAAHELKTPLAAIRVQTEVLGMESVTEAQKKQMEKIIQAVDRTNHLVNQLLTLSRLEENSQLTNKSSLAIDNIFLGQAHELKNLVEQKQARLVVAAGEPFEITGDPILFSILFKNLIENSLKYSEPGVQITLKMSPREFSLEDTGPGIAPEMEKRLGERFYRPEGQKVIGSGLGLSIVKRIAELHGLSMRIRNSYEGGLKIEFSYS